MYKILGVLSSYFTYKYLHRFKNREKLLKWQNKELMKHVKRVVSASPFYKELYKNCDINNPEALPIIDKKIMMDNFNTLNTRNITSEEAFKIALEAENTRNFEPLINGTTVGLSSGTSGNRGLFLVSTKERLAWAGCALARLLPSGIFRKQKVAFFMRANSNLYSTINSKRISFKFYDILESMESHINTLNSQKPTMLIGAPSVLRILADAQKEGKLCIDPVKIISIAEVLEDIDKEFISHVFKQPVYQVYQCTEGFIGYSCKYGTIHINEDVVMVQKEYLDSTRFIPVISDFKRFTQPILRYRLNDVLVEKKETCKCGSVYLGIEKIEGREDDIFYLNSKSDTRIVAVFPDFIRNSVIAASENILEYRVVQEDLKTVKIFLKLNENSNIADVKANIENSFDNLCNKLSCQKPALVFEEFLPKDKGVKLRRVERCFKIN
ncbi:MAG TPA: F390 synthetase-related protein [Clostridia bacterium]